MKIKVTMPAYLPELGGKPYYIQPEGFVYQSQGENLKHSAEPQITYTASSIELMCRDAGFKIPGFSGFRPALSLPSLLIVNLPTQVIQTVPIRIITVQL